VNTETTFYTQKLFQMTLKHLLAPALMLVAFSFWYCQKSPQPELNTPAQSLSASGEREELACPISVPDPTCSAQIRARCISVAPGAEYNNWEVAGKWYGLQNGATQFFPFTISGGFGGPYQLGVWYDIPNPVIKQPLLDQFCPGRENSIECIVLSSDEEGNQFDVTQWSMWVDIRSGNKITTYYMNGATGIMTPTPLSSLVDPSVAFDRTDVDFLSNCSNMGAQGVLCNPMLGCTQCSVSVDPGGH
jgi:hypothetical protein